MFQSLIGRLETRNQKEVVLCAVQFQSLIGRLETWAGQLALLCIGQFQSLIGRLETSLTGRRRDDEIYVSIPHR